MSKLRLWTWPIIVPAIFGPSPAESSAEKDEAASASEIEEREEKEDTFILELEPFAQPRHDRQDAEPTREPEDAGPDTVYGKDFCRCRAAGSRTPSDSLLFLMLACLSGP